MTSNVCNSTTDLQTVCNTAALPQLYKPYVILRHCSNCMFCAVANNPEKYLYENSNCFNLRSLEELDYLPCNNVPFYMMTLLMGIYIDLPTKLCQKSCPIIPFTKVNVVYATFPSRLTVLFVNIVCKVSFNFNQTFFFQTFISSVHGFWVPIIIVFVVITIFFK